MPQFSSSSSGQNSILATSKVMYLSLMMTKKSCQLHVGRMFLLHVVINFHSPWMFFQFPSFSATQVFVDASDISWSHSRGSPTCHCIRALKVFRFVALCRTFSPFFLKQESTLLNKQQNKPKNCSHVAARIESLDTKIGITKSLGLFHLNKCFSPTKSQYTDLISAYSKSSGCMQAETLDHQINLEHTSKNHRLVLALNSTFQWQTLLK